LDREIPSFLKGDSSVSPAAIYRLQKPAAVRNVNQKHERVRKKETLIMRVDIYFRTGLLYAQLTGVIKYAG
jgi:hypothetical protein